MLEKTTAIIPTFNRSLYLVETLNSLLKQNLQPDEIIVVDDGSTDDTTARVAGYGTRIRYLRKQNSGKAASLNHALAISKNPLIWIVDDDDIALPNALQDMTILISGKEEIGLVYGRYDRFKETMPGRIERFNDCGYWQDVPPDEFLIATMNDFFVHHPGMLVRKSAYNAVGDFSSRYSRLEDYEMLVRLARRHCVVSTNKVVFLQRQHDGIRAGNLQGERARVERWRKEEAELFDTLYSEIPLREYLPLARRPGGADLSASQQREALIVRGAIMARKTLWEKAFADFTAASYRTDAGLNLSQYERTAIRRALFSKYGCPEIYNTYGPGKQLRLLAGFGPIGAAIAQTFGRSYFWFIRRDLQRGRLSEAVTLINHSLYLLLAPQRANKQLDLVQTADGHIEKSEPAVKRQLRGPSRGNSN